MKSADPLQSYLKSVRQMTGAASASLLLPSACENSTNELLFHDGDTPPVHELSSMQAAEHFLAKVNSAMQVGEGPVSTCAVHAFRGVDKGGCLLRVCTRQFHESLHANSYQSSQKERRARRRSNSAAVSDQSVWIGLQFRSEVPPRLLEEVQGTESDYDAGEPLPGGNWLAWNLAFGIHIARQAYQLSCLLHDPISRLPGRVEFQAHLNHALKEATQKRQLLGLALINPDDFGHINHRLGRESGDTALRELAEQLQGVLRQSDVLFRYGGAVFGLVMRTGSAEEAHRAAERIRLALSQLDLLKGAARLTFSVGMVVYNAEDQDDSCPDANELMRRADRALNAAKLSGGGRTVLWEPGGLASVVENLDRLSGIFTADTEKDYRNMLLLWDTVTVITSHTESRIIATEFVERLGSTFKPKKLVLYEATNDGEHSLLAAFGDQFEKRLGQGSRTGQALPEKLRELIQRARRSRRAERLRLGTDAHKANAEKTSIAYAVPLLARGNYMGCLYIDGQLASFTLDSSDMIFLSALANQVAMALDRARLAMRWKQQKEQESRQLKQEVRGLRNALQHSRLVYRSTQMQDVLDVLRRIAPTDTTVLITGESGTGKEVLARTLHEQSQRHKQPFVTVDCGAIAQNLLEAELFGHVKGAFTGAQAASVGRISQAVGGTLFLDEIGELPLELQAKLLRLVQEKELTPVGATKSRKVDVRIVAATNRDLAAESVAGTFRQDLYYRLQVVTLTSPPLRERPNDILPLAHYFLEKFAVQNDKSARRLSPDAEAALLRYPWTGNVRELQNRILQAVVMSDMEEIDRPALGLSEAETCEPRGGNQSLSIASEPIQHEPLAPLVSANSHADRAAPFSLENVENPMAALREGLAYHVRVALSSGKPVPLGRWLVSDLLLAADQAVNGVARRASALLGMAETTFRRQIEKVRQESLMGQSLRTPDWPALKPVLTRILSTHRNAHGQNLVDQASRLLLEEVLAQAPDNDNLGSALLGVTKPTFQRRKAALQS